MSTANMKHVILELRHDELIPFLSKQVGWDKTWGKIYWSINIILFGMLTYFAFKGTDVSFGQAVMKIGLGFFLFFLLIPLHEMIHGLVYKWAGAKKVVYKAVWSKLVFYAVADKFIANRKQFNRVALAPFIVINTLLVTLFFIAETPNNLIYFGSIILHTGGCFGDFALISFMHEHRSQNISMMDDLSTERTYFFEQTRETT